MTVVGNVHTHINGAQSQLNNLVYILIILKIYSGQYVYLFYVVQGHFAQQEHRNTCLLFQVA